MHPEYRYCEIFSRTTVVSFCVKSAMLNLLIAGATKYSGECFSGHLNYTVCLRGVSILNSIYLAPFVSNY